MTEEELVREYRPLVLRFSMRLAGDEAEAEDLTQETLLKAIAGLGRFEGRSTVASWLYRITVNAWKNRLRARASRFARRLETAEGAADRVPSDEPTPEAAALAAEKRRRVERALARLTPGERAVLEARELEGHSYEEIAARLALPLGTVKSRLARARDILAQELYPEHEHGA